MPYSIVKLDQDLRLAILEKVGVYSVRFSIQEPHTMLATKFQKRGDANQDDHTQSYCKSCAISLKPHRRSGTVLEISRYATVRHLPSITC